MLAAINRFIVFAVLAVIGLLLWVTAQTEVGISGHPFTLVEKLSGVTGVILNLAGLWAIGWGAPKIVRAVERQADQTAKLAAQRSEPAAPLAPATDAEADAVAAQVFKAYQRFAARHPEFAKGVSEEAFRNMWWFKRRSYRSFMMRAVAFFTATFDAAGFERHSKWKQAVWDALDLHPAAKREWGDELGIKDLSITAPGQN
jgi:hypothetical protein